ncbi:MAG TPA: chemotaxis protein CheX [Bryobacteraceae bacterium]|nr:chemotaxis protein CheX [Bryobacteraceae bacterium]
MSEELEQVCVEMDPAAGDMIQHVAAEVLETMFFTEAEPVECDHVWLEIAPCAQIRFDGSHSGEMVLGVSAEAAEPIAASFLGLDPMELTDAQRGQVLQELANILCGAMVSHLWPESKLALASPELTGWQEWLSQGVLHRCFALPEGMLAISIRLLGAPTAGA